MFITCSTSYCLVTLKGLWNACTYVCMYNCRSCHRAYRSCEEKHRCVSLRSGEWLTRLDIFSIVIWPEFGLWVTGVDKAVLNTRPYTLNFNPISLISSLSDSSSFMSFCFEKSHSLCIYVAQSALSDELKYSPCRHFLFHEQHCVQETTDSV